LTSSQFVQDVRRTVEGKIARAMSFTGDALSSELLEPGKMLRARLAARLLDASLVDESILQAACTATELVHTASLCHDDVVDNSLIRRSLPTLWRSAGASGAILVGDLLLCEAIDVLTDSGDGRLLSPFIRKIAEVVQAEAEQELRWRGNEVDAETCLRLARGKTGPLFAFVASVCGGGDGKLAGALEEAGYCTGAAYQLSDDLLDVLGTESDAGKTLGTDLARGKHTLPQVGVCGQDVARDNIARLCSAALACLDDYPAMRDALAEYLLKDLQAVWDQCPGVDMGIAV